MMTACSPSREHIGSDTSWMQLPVNGLLMVCAWCEKIRDEKGHWQRMERHADKHGGRTSHGMCPKCAGVLTRELDAAARVKRCEKRAI